jgi:MoxR-like ATPase
MLTDVEKFCLREFWEKNPNQMVATPADFKKVAKPYGLEHSDYRVFLNPVNRESWGKYTLEPFLTYKDELLNTKKIQETLETESEIPMQNVVSFKTSSENKPKMHDITNTGLAVPHSDSNFVPWGFYKDIKTIIKNKTFFPVFISGLSGSGKTIFVRQACAELKRPYIRIQITSETDETDLLGSWRLQDGETVWVDGPIVTAAKEGAICLIDEIDRSSSRIASLLGILEGQPILIKKTGEIVTPKEGFNIVATGNTKGRGSVDGKYTFAIIVDEALLERFYINYTQVFPNEKTVHKILSSYSDNTPETTEFISYLSRWVSMIYQTFERDAIDDIISIRRAVQILKIFETFKNPTKAIKLGVSRFDEIEQNAFLDLFNKVSGLTIKKEDEDDDVTISSDNLAEGVDVKVLATSWIAQKV